MLLHPTPQASELLSITIINSSLHTIYSTQSALHLPVALSSEQAGIPGLQIYLDFISPEDEQALLHQIDQQPWTHLAKRRVQHYGYKFEYSQRGVDPQQKLGHLPHWVQPLQQRLEVQQHCTTSNSIMIQLYNGFL